LEPSTSWAIGTGEKQADSSELLLQESHPERRGIMSVRHFLAVGLTVAATVLVSGCGTCCKNRCCSPAVVSNRPCCPVPACDSCAPSCGPCAAGAPTQAFSMSPAPMASAAPGGCCGK